MCHSLAFADGVLVAFLILPHSRQFLCLLRETAIDA